MKDALGMAALVAAFLYVAPVHCSRPVGAREVATASQIEAFHEALESCRTDTGGFPSNEHGLGALRNMPVGVKGWNGPYLPKNIPLDAWNHPFIYDSAGPTVTSLGADGKPGGFGSNKDITVGLKDSKGI